MDGSKEKTLWKFKKKLNDAGIYIRQIEPYSPWLHQVEQTIRELKKASARKMMKTGSPKRLLGDCIEFEAYVSFNISNFRADLKDQTPETFVSGQTADISEFAELRCYNWVMCRDMTVLYPGSKSQFGRYCGLAYDIGPAMCAKILKGEGEYDYRSNLRRLTANELANPV